MKWHGWGRPRRSIGCILCFGFQPADNASCLLLLTGQCVSPPTRNALYLLVHAESFPFLLLLSVLPPYSGLLLLKWVEQLEEDEEGDGTEMAGQGSSCKASNPHQPLFNLVKFSLFLTWIAQTGAEQVAEHLTDNEFIILMRLERYNINMISLPGCFIHINCIVFLLRFIWARPLSVLFFFKDHTQSFVMNT